MTQTTHTPGPWWPDDRVDCEWMAQCLIENPTWIAVEDTADDGGHIAYCAPDNAHLIAAAPDMLAVLEGMDEELSLWGADTIETMNLKARLGAIRAAIAKAKGE